MYEEPVHRCDSLVNFKHVFLMCNTRIHGYFYGFSERDR